MGPCGCLQAWPCLSAGVAAPGSKLRARKFCPMGRLVLAGPSLWAPWALKGLAGASKVRELHTGPLYMRIHWTMGQNLPSLKVIRSCAGHGTSWVPGWVLGFWVPDSGFLILGFVFQIPSPGFWSLGSGFCFLGPAFRVPSPGFRHREALDHWLLHYSKRTTAYKWGYFTGPRPAPMKISSSHGGEYDYGSPD